MNKLLKILKTAFVVIFAFIVTGCNKDEQAPTKDAYIVTFNSNGGSEIAEVEVKAGDYLKKPSDPDKEGYTFIEWQLNGRRFNFSTPIKEDITLKAKWELTGTGDQTVSEYTVFFDSDGGTKMENVKVKSGTKVNKPKDPTKAGYTFIEWQLNGNAYDFENAVNQDIELIAKWNKIEEPKPSPSPSIKPSPSPSIVPSPSPSVAPSPSPSVKPSPSPSTNPSPSPSVKPSLPEPDPIGQSKTVFFNTDGGSTIEAIVVKEGLPVTRPVNPAKDGHSFKEWQLNGVTFDFNTKIYENITLTAIWTQKAFTFSLTDIENDTENKRVTVYEENAEKTVKEIQLMDGTKLCDGTNPIIPITALENVTQLKIVLTSNITVIANIK